MPISWEALAAEPVTPIPFLINPYIPEEGIILLYGKTRTGKSPLTWEIARCVGSGEPFFGHQTRAGRVLYLELDTPKRLVQPRLTQLPPAPNVWWEFISALNLFQLGSQALLREIQSKCYPDLVIVNTLRAVHYGDEKDASLPLRIYKTFQAIFLGAAILFVHHDKKSSGDPTDSSDPDEAFSGHMAWLNHCQTGIHLLKSGGNTSVKGILRLKHSKSQVSAEASDLILKLDEGGTHLVLYSSQRLLQLLTVYQALPVEAGKTERVRIVAKQVGLSERQVWTYLSRLPEATEVLKTHDI